MKTASALCALLLSPLAALAQSAPPAAVPAPTGDAKMSSEPTFVISKWKAKLYGFAELDTMVDSTQSFAEIPGSGIVSKPGTVAGDNGRTQFTIRNSRLGFNLESPDFNGIKGIGVLEGDFFGFNNNPAYPSNASNPSEAGFYTNPTFRVRHAYVKIVTPYLDILGGQTWNLFTFDTNFMPATVALQGILGEAFQRTPQIRLGKAIDLGGGTKLDVQLAAARPVQRDAVQPDFSGGLRLEYGGLSGFKTTGGVGFGAVNAQLAVSGVAKKFRAQSGAPTSTTDFQTATGTGLAANLLLPILSGASKTNRAGALTLLAEFTTGSGYGDAFNGFSAGTAVGTPQDLPAGKTYGGVTFDNGVAGWDQSATTATLATVDVQSLYFNVQYYLPFDDGNFLLSAYASQIKTGNSAKFAAQTDAGKQGTLDNTQYASLGLLWDVTPATRVGLEGAWTRSQMNTDSAGGAGVRVNRRLLYSMWFSF
jgi:hypothetical protein